MFLFSPSLPLQEVLLQPCLGSAFVFIQSRTKKIFVPAPDSRAATNVFLQKLYLESCIFDGLTQSSYARHFIFPSKCIRSFPIKHHQGSQAPLNPWIKSYRALSASGGPQKSLISPPNIVCKHDKPSFYLLYSVIDWCCIGLQVT